MSANEPKKSGHKSSVRGAIELTWISEAVPVPRTAGRFVSRVTAEPDSKVDGSQLGATPLLKLEVTIAANSQANSIDLAVNLFDFLNALSQFERTLGGAGFFTRKQTRDNGTLTLTLSSIESTGAGSRVSKICDILNEGQNIPLPPSVTSVHAKVA